MDEPRQGSIFFAHEEIDLYDATVDLAAPHYRLLHEVELAVVGLCLGNEPGAIDVLDLGSGTGVTSEALLSRFPALRVVALDYSARANELLERKLAPRFGMPGADSRWQVLEVDILAAAAEGIDPVNWCRPERRGEGFAGVVTSLTLHHFGYRGVRDTYRWAAGALAPGGFLVNADFFDFPPATFGSIDLAAHAQRVTREWIAAGFDHPSLSGGGTCLAAATRRRLKSSWLRHVDREHRLLPLEVHIEMLGELGFESVACPFRYWQSGVLCATRRG